MNFVDVPQKSGRWVSLTPLIDVVFILIMFFMLTTQFSSIRFISVLTPEQNASAATTRGNDDDKETARVFVVDGTTWRFNNQTFSTDDAEAIEALSSYRNVRLLVEDDVTLQQVISVIDEFAKAGVRELLWLPAQRSDAP